MFNIVIFILSVIFFILNFSLSFGTKLPKDRKEKFIAINGVILLFFAFSIDNLGMISLIAVAPGLIAGVPSVIRDFK